MTIARSLVNNPAIVWADEPTGALDSNTATEIMGLMKALNTRESLTVVIVTHDHSVGNQCQRIIDMRDGLIISEHRPMASEADSPVQQLAFPHRWLQRETLRLLQSSAVKT